MKTTQDGWYQSMGLRMARSDHIAAVERSEANGRLRSHPALIAIVRLLARQAAHEALIASRVEQENNRNDEED